MAQPSVLVVSKQREDPFVEDGLAFVSLHFPESIISVGNRGDKLPEEITSWEGDYIISYLSPWILPRRVLDKAKVAAINLHPAPPEYPGSGCYNFALYDNAKTYGITCHHMAPAVDTGKIVSVRRFPVFPADTIQSLVKRSAACMLLLFYEIMTDILSGNPLAESDETWQRKPYTMAGMYEMFQVTPEMPKEEIRKRIRAAEYPGWRGAYVELDGERFYHESPPY